MLRFRSDVSQINPYRPGKPIIEVAADFGFDPADVVKLASNEHPLPPMEAAQKAIVERIREVNRYPDNEARLLRRALADDLGVDYDCVWVGAGSSELLRVAATALGGPGTSAVYAWPSFVVYRLASIIAGSRPIEVPLDATYRHDLEGMREAINADTSLVYICNPNNPTGTVVSAAALEEFVSSIPADVAIVIDEAYHEYVVSPEYSTSIRLVEEYPNVIVTRTFSKVYGLASLRVGYAVARVGVVSDLRKAQGPFSVTDMGQAGAVASLADKRELARRIRSIAAGRETVETALARLGVEYVPSQANFVYFRLGAGKEEIATAFLHHAVILRLFSGGWLRVTVGTDDENRRFLEALEAEIKNLA